MATTKKSAAKKPAAKKSEAKKAAAPKAAKKGAKGAKEKDIGGVRTAAAEVRATQEEGSIAPPTKGLVSAFAIFKSRRPASAPAVTRLAAGSALPKPPAPPKPAEEKPAAPVPVAKPAQPVSQAAAPAATPKPAAPAVKPPPIPSAAPARPAPPAQRPGAPAAHPAQPPQRPSQLPAQRPVHPPKPAPKPQAKPPAAPPAAPPVAAAATGAPAEKPPLKPLEVSSMITVRELAEKMEVKSNDVIKKLMALGVFATINQRLETEAAAIVAQDFGFDLKVVAMYKEEEVELAATHKEPPEKLKPRPPIVTVMGHVDHGKTSLLDAIRSARVAEGESGGITQHIGAYKVKTAKGDVTFLDTPGHEAFTAMRARGAKVTDIVILVVSATDGVMPQTIEAIDHSKAADVPIVVAVNKIDLPGANPQKIRQELANHGLQPEEWGGKTIFVDVSAKKRLNLDKLLEMVALQAEVLELKANPDRPGYGVILEARLDPKRGTVATLLVQAGCVKVGDSFVAGLSYGKIKALLDDAGNRVPSAGPSTPVEVLGIMGLPQAGDPFTVISDERQARDIAEKRRLIHREQALAHQKHVTLVGLKSQGAGAKELKIVLKADVQGSLQALRDSLEALTNPECRVRIIHAALGNATESDVLLASASDAVALLFHVDIEPRAKELADRDGVEIRRYEIIYDLIADVKAALEGLLAPEIVDVVVGKGEVREIFPLKGGGKVAGCFIREGKAVRGGLVKVLRGGAIVFDGKIATLKRFKDDVKEVEKNLECGMSFEGFNDIQKGDQLEFIIKESRTRRLNQARQ